MVHVIIVLPGTTGTSLVESQAEEASLKPLWMQGVLTELKLEPLTGVAATTAQMEKTTLWAGRPGGYGKIDKTTGGPAGYASLIDSIVAAAKTAGATYTAMYTNWPTDSPPLAATSAQSWGLTLPLTGNAVIGWGYDWRQDNLAVTGPMLQNFLYNLTGTGSQVDRITLIGHSMGGLVSRSYIEAVGPQSKNPQDAKILGMIDQLITLGTPHLGAPLALGPISHTFTIDVHGQASGNIFLKAFTAILGDVEQFVADHAIDMVQNVVNSNPMGVSTYQLLPTVPFIQSGGTNYPVYPFGSLPSGLQGLLKDTDINQENLTAATTFFGQLDYTGAKQTIPYQCLYGIVSTSFPPYGQENMFTTVTGYTYTPGKDPLVEVQTNGGGDLVVPITSATFTGNTSPLIKTYPIDGADHMTMPNNPAIQSQVNTLLNFAS